MKKTKNSATFLAAPLPLLEQFYVQLKGVDVGGAPAILCQQLASKQG
jgi:hypothetical protein